jgi:hypothetical protein
LWRLKKIAAILLAGILFFNWYGYHMVSAWLESRAGRQLEARLDENRYDESQLILVKVPATSLSYYNISSRFERVDGRVEIGGVQYKYVKRRIINDFIEYLCIPDHAAMDLKMARDEFFKQVNDLQQHNGAGKKTGHSLTKTFAPDYLCQEPDGFGPAVSVVREDITGIYTADRLRSLYTPTPENPPDFILA